MPLSNEEYVELAAAGTFVIQASSKQIEIEDMLITSDTDGAYITVADNNDKPTSRKLFLRKGINDFCEWAINFVGGKDVTITCTGGNVTLFVRYARK